MKRFRETRLGRFVTKQQADDNPDTTVAETIGTCREELADCRWQIEAWRTVMLQASGDLHNMVMHHSTSDDKLAKVADTLEDAAHGKLTGQASSP